MSHPAPRHPQKGKTGLIRVWKAFFYSMAGLKAAYVHESAFRQECWLAIIFTPLALCLPVDIPSKALLAGSTLLILIVELLNSAIEAVVDRISFEHHELATRAKDIGSAAVFIALVNWLLLWGLILGHHWLTH